MVHKLSEYDVLETLHHSERSIVYRARQRQAGDDGETVILKLSAGESPSPTDLRRLERDWEIGRHLQGEEFVPVRDFERRQTQAMVVKEDVGAVSLDRIIARRRLGIGEFLDMAIAISRAVGRMHDQGVIHRDINPSNIIWNHDRGRAWLIDFGLSSKREREQAARTSAQHIEGTLAYISPEQTGRTSRLLDYRSDFYSLGVTLYEMVSGRLPFDTEDATELVYSHLARRPSPPHQHRPEVPVALAEVIMKCMAKQPDERYQSARGLQYDLEACRKQWEATAGIEAFELGQRDVRARLRISEKLYGRQGSIQRLEEAFRQVQRGDRRGVLIAGEPGVGKSALLDALQVPVIGRGGWFVSGSFEMPRQARPYRAFGDALGTMIENLLGRREEELSTWRRDIEFALGDNASLVAGVVPALESLIDVAPTQSYLDMREGKVRFRRAFQGLIEVFCNASHPLVICLENLQWADDASMELVDLLLSDREFKHLLVIGTYRPAEVKAGSSFGRLLEATAGPDRLVEQLSLSALDVSAVRQMVADTVSQSVDEVAPLADLIHRKTSGNPYFVRQFMFELYRHDGLGFDPDCGRWRWDLEAVAEAPATDNVVDALAARIDRLDERARHILKVASLIGRRFSLEFVATCVDESPAEVYRRLESAIAMDVLVAVSSSGLPSQGNMSIPHHLAFSHDQIQETVRARWDRQDRQRAHLDIGQILRDRLGDDEGTTGLFSVVEHLNRGRSQLDDQGERLELVALNVKAAARALHSQAIATAIQYLGAAHQLIGDRLWDMDKPLARQLTLLRARAHTLGGDFERARDWIDEALQRLNDPVEKVPFYRLLIEQMALQTKFEAALDIGCRSLEELGYPLHIEDLDRAVAQAFDDISDRLDDRALQEVLEHSYVGEPTDEAALKLLATLQSPAGLVDMRLLTLVGLKSMAITLSVGVRPESVMGIASFGTVLAREHQPQRGYEAGQLALRLSRQFGEASALSHVAFVLAAMVMPWAVSMHEGSALFQEGMESGLRTGNHLFAGFNSMLDVLYRFYRGQDLQELLRDADQSFALSEEIQNIVAQDLSASARMVIRNLVGETATAKDYSDQRFESGDAYLDHCRSLDNEAGVVVFRISRAAVRYLYGDAQGALVDLEATENNLAPLLGTYDVARHPFYHAMALVDVLLDEPDKGPSGGRRKLAKLRQCMAQMSDECSDNFQHKLSLIDAELARLDGRVLEAMHGYDRAIAEAAEQRFIHLEALANERAGRFWEAQQKPDFGALYLREARYLYKVWGARRKVRLLDREYGDRLMGDDGRERGASSDSSSGDDIDVNSVFKASEAIASSLGLQELLRRLMEVILENAGAQRGTFIVIDEGDPNVAVEARIGAEPVISDPPLPLQSWDSGARSVVRYVIRSGESVVVGRANHDPRFRDDPYIDQKRPRSILCLPVAEQGEQRGILYAENNLVDEAFTQERTRTVKILAGHIAIALNKARLYASLHEEKERFRQLAENIQEVFWLMDWPQADIVYVSPAYKSVWGQSVPQESIPIEDWLDGVVDEDRLRVEESLRRHVASGEYDETYRIERPSGQRRWIRDRGFPIHDEHGNPVRVAGVAVDITREHEVERMKEEFISVVSHELRTPLTPVTGIFSMLTGEYADQLPEEVLEMADLGMRNSRRLLELIDDLLDIQKLSMDKVEFRTELLDLREIVAESVELNRPVGELQGVSMALDAVGDPLLVEGDRSRLLQVMTNLLSNAVKFSPPQSTVGIEVCQREQWARISVVDRGPGIPHAARDRIFEKFTQADSSLTRRHGGTGLGLAIARAIVERLGGRIGFDTELDEGSVFFVEFPLVCTEQ